MPNENWGVKRLCPTSGKRFYDMGRSPIVSPYTGEVVTFDANNKSRVAAADKNTAKVVEEEDDDLVDDDAVVLDDDVDIDDDLLDDDDDDDDNVSLDELADVAANDDDN
ncbi:MAG: TIGR02300 family protein [Paracoccaceae bacterium]